MAKLVVEKGRDKGKILVLKEGSFLVGRDLKTHLRLRDLQASRRHLTVSLSDGEVFLEDQESSNGTFVNGERILRTKLKAGDKIQVGESLIFYLDEESVDETQTVDTLSVTANRRGELTGREVAGYRVGRLLGRGGMGTVYEAIQVSLERRVAFKVLAKELTADKQFVDRFTAEARAAGALNHPNIVQVYDVGSSNDVRFYSMEFMAKGSVEDLLRTHGRLPAGHALAIAFDAARGLEYAERKGLVHRDIKPDNLMISEDDVIKIGDLGIATRRRAEHEGPGEDGVSGSPHYIAPEQALGKAIDIRADLYALGVSLYQILCGETPYEGTSAREVILKHLNEKAPPLQPRVPDAPPNVVSLVERLMEKDPQKRPVNASALLQELVPLLRVNPVTETGALRIGGFLSKRLELSMQASGALIAPPRPPSGSTPVPTIPGQATTETRTPLPAATDVVEKPLKETTTVGRAHTVLAFLGSVLAAIALGVAAFSIVHGLRARAERDRIERQNELVRVKKLLDKDPRLCESEAKKLEQQFEVAGARDDVNAAHEIATQAARKTADAELAHKRKAADEALADAKRQLDEVPETADDPEHLARIEKTIELYGKLAKDHPGTPAAETAEKGKVRAERDQAAALLARKERLATEAEIKQLFEQTQGAIADYVKRQHFDDALNLVHAFESKYKDIELAKQRGAALRLKIKEGLKDTLNTTFEQVKQLVESKPPRFTQARDLLNELMRNLTRDDDEVKAARKRVAAALDQLKQAETQHGMADPEKRRADEEKRVATVEETSKSSIKERQFESAAELFEAAAVEVTSRDLKDQLIWRAERLRLAAASVNALIDLVKTEKEDAGIELRVQVAGTAVWYRASAASRQTLQLTFHEVRDASLTFDQSVSDTSPGVLVSWATKAAKEDPVALLSCAALALELNRADLAAQTLKTAKGLGVPEARKRAFEHLAKESEATK